MIVKTTNLDSAYLSLFDEIRAASNGNIDVNNIEQFFGNIVEISQLDKKFLRLPLDEPIFEINANTRAITVPAEFRTNGISVQGDHLAETVFFSIDRYFDRMDLNVPDITINWKMGANSGKTKCFIKSTDIIPGKVVFGWPINDIVTQKSGSLAFAVEFNITNSQTDEVKYDFNTLSASINVKDGLVIGADAEVVSLDDAVMSILVNSSFGEGDAAVGDISWLSQLVSGTGVGDELRLNAYQNPLMLSTVIDNESGEPSSVPAKLYGQAFVDKGTIIVYTDALNNNVDKVMVPVTASELSDDLIYYKKVDNAYEKANDLDKANWAEEDSELILYVEMAVLNANTNGNYVLKAQGVKQDTSGHKIGNGEVSSCELLVIPAAETPSKINITKSELENIPEGYSFDEEACANVVFLDNGEAALTVNAEVASYGALLFIWQKKENNTFVNIEEEIPHFLANNENILSITAAGEYQVKVKNFQNNSYSNDVVSDIIIASELASEITGAVCRANGNVIPVTNRIDFNSNSSSMSNRSVTLSVETGIPTRGELSYEWKLGDTVVSTSASCIVSAEGEYTPVVKNTYNGSIFTKELSAIFVNDIANDGL